MSLRQKLLTAYGAMALLALLIAAMTLWTSAQWGATSDTLQDHYQRSLQLQGIRASVFRAFKEVPDAVSGGDPDAHHEFDALLVPVEEDFARWGDLADTEEEREQVRRVRERFDAMLRSANAVFDLVEQGRGDEAYVLLEGQLEDGDFVSFQEVTDAAVASDRSKREVIREQVASTRRTTQLAVGLAAFGMVSLSLLVAAYLASDLFAPLREVRRALADVAGGNLGAQLDEGRRDELGEVNRAFNGMAAAIAQRLRVAGLAAVPDGTATDGGRETEGDWQRLPSRLALHTLVAQLRSRVGLLSRDGDGAVGEDVTTRRELVDELDQLSLAVARLTDFGFPLDLNLDRTDVRTLLYEVLLRFHDEFARRSVSLEVEIAPEVGEAVVDRLKLREVLVELVRNALAALPERGGRLGLRASVALGGTELVLEVADDGTGVEPAQIDAAFAPFATTRPHHAGVGLTLAGAVVEQHGGRLGVESEPGRGTHVVIGLPLREQA